jgi:hypothetical protein
MGANGRDGVTGPTGPKGIPGLASGKGINFSNYVS